MNASDLALLILRLALSVVFLAHGWNHLFRGGRIAGTTRWFASLGMQPARVHAVVASFGEIIAAGLLFLGFLVPVGCAIVVGTMTVAWVTNHARNGFFIFRPGEGYEYVMVLVALGVGLGGLGGGRLSLDHVLGTEFPEWVGLALAGGGAVVAAGLLTACWRPKSVAVPADG